MRLFFRLWLCAVFFSVSAVSGADRNALDELYRRGQVLEGMYRRPVSTGKGPAMLLLCGGRPWLANDFAKIFIRAGFRVNLLNGVYLAGLSGASIKITPDDLRELTPLDGITPEFDNLAAYKIVFVNLISAENQEKLFTPERIGKHEKFVAGGGALVLTVNAPESLGELLPVRKSPAMDSMEWIEEGDFFARRPAGKDFEILPEKWKLYGAFRNASCGENAEILADITDEGGHPVGIYLAQKKYGKGKVIFWNA
ncbi:MAG: hypothetical protein MJ016_02425, partial [Victivallaceae bacterium]|nr:hypothetical protein [Victivallaceae bacterium]